MQRASLCRALIHDPQLLMLDEPFGALDQFTREELWSIMQSLWLERKPTGSARCNLKYPSLGIAIAAGFVQSGSFVDAVSCVAIFFFSKEHGARLRRTYTERHSNKTREIPNINSLEPGKGFP